VNRIGRSFFRLWLLAWILGSPGCQVFDEFHYVYVLPEPSGSESMRASEESADRETDPGNDRASINGASKEGSPDGPAINFERELYIPESRAISSGRGDSLRFYAASDSASTSGQKKVEIYATIVDPTIARNIYRNSRGPRDGGRMPDLFLLELQISNQDETSVRFDPYSTTVECNGSRFLPLEPARYWKDYATYSNVWLSYGWHMVPRNSAFFYRPDPEDYILEDEYLMSEAKKAFLENRRLDFLKQLRKPVVLDSADSVNIILPFERLPDECQCILSIKMPAGDIQKFRFSKVRMESEEWKAHRKKLESQPGPVRYLNERQMLLQDQSVRKDELQKKHIQRRKEFCKELSDSESKNSGFSYCQDSFWFRWFDSGFE